MSDNIQRVIVGSVLSLLTVLALTTGKVLIDLRQEVALLRRDVEQMRQDTAAETRQNETLSRHWRLHGWTRDQISTLRVAGGLPLDPWPDLSE